MRVLAFLLFAAAVAYSGWPYVNLYRLDRALMANDRTALEELVNLDALRAQRKAQMDRQVERSIAEQQGPIPDLMRGGARWFGDQRAYAIDVDWVRDRLRWRRPTAPDAYPSLISDTSFAFFESPTRFLIRIGDLGENPIHIRMHMENWKWRVTEIHD